MELSEIYQNNSFGVVSEFSPKISFEVYPGDMPKLFEELRILRKYNPVLVSLTYGASGALNRFSIEDLKSIQDLEFNLMPHFTCVSMIKDEIEKHLRSIENLGIENILALRGDIPDYISKDDLDFKYASEIVEFIKEKTTLSIGVAGYPECHIECKNIHQDIENLKRKVDKGASAIFTQLFFDNDKFYKYLESVKKAGINIPVIPGIMPVRSLKQIDKMLSMTHVTFPNKFKNQLEKYPNDTKKISIEFCISQCRDLISNGVKGLHFFTLNHSDMVSEILDNI